MRRKSLHCCLAAGVALRGPFPRISADWVSHDRLAVFVHDVQHYRDMRESGTAKDLEFPSTHWSSVLAAGETESEQGLEALDRLIRRYEPALKAYLRQKFGLDEGDARDVFQSFLLEVVLRKELIRKARPIKGYQFRSFLLTAFHNFVASDMRRELAQKRRPEGGFVAIDESSDRELGHVSAASSELFDVSWARAVVADALPLRH